MPAISVDVAGESPSYGVKADETFWCKQGVLRRSQLRDSEDEQMIADLAITILKGGLLHSAALIWMSFTRSALMNTRK